MIKVNWRLIDLFLLLLFVAVGLGGHRLFWDTKMRWDQWPNYRIVFLLFLASVTTTSIGAFFGRAPLRSFCIGYALFGWLHLALTLDWGVVSSDNNGLARLTVMGAPLAALCGILSYWIVKSPADHCGKAEAHRLGDVSKSGKTFQEDRLQ